MSLHIQWQIVTIKISHLSSLFSKYLLSVYVPDPVLDAGDTAIHKTDKNNFPSGTYSPMFQMQNIAIKKRKQIKKKVRK